jgi:hypothetical protein
MVTKVYAEICEPAGDWEGLPGIAQNVVFFAAVFSCWI